jgi:D-3-phosphoglycerate dehydrogenase / 2-oxoglutarate reductase
MSMAKPRVFLTNPIDRVGYEILKDVEIVTASDSSPATLRKEIGDADAIIVRANLPPDIFERGRRLRACVRHGAGLDLIPVDAATAHGIPVANVPGVNANAVAEYVVAQMLLGARRLHRVDSMHRSQNWAAARKFADEATELRGKSAGIVGVGAIGLRVAEILHHGFGMRVLGYRRRLDALPAFVTGIELDELLRLADYVVLACPLTPETRGLLDERRIGLLKKNAFIVNVSRGPVLDEPALVAALRERRIGGAALDVYVTQPLPRDSELLRLDNAILSTHLAGLSAESVQAMSRIASEETLRILGGDKPVNFCNPEVWEKSLARRRQLCS